MHYDQLFPRGCPVQASGRFVKFQRLPPEIRNMIWEYALPEARVYEVLDAPNAKHKTPARDGLMFANVHPEPPPALAAVCRESRSFVLHHYKPLTLGKTTKFIDVSRDILLLEPYLLVKRLHRTLHFLSQIPLVRDHATRLALGTSYGIYPGIFHPVLGRKVSKNNMSKLLAGLAKFPRLKTLVFVVHQEFQFEFDFRFPGTLTPMPSAYGSLPSIAPSFVAPGHGLPSSAGLGVAGYPSPPASSNGGLLSASLSPLPVSLPPTTTTTKPTALTSLGLPSPANSTMTTPSSSPPPPPPQLPPLVHATLHPLPSPQTQPLPPQHAPSPPVPSSAHHHPQHQHHYQQQQQQHEQHLQQHQQQQQQQPQQQQQQVHQAYRFKFDIEANINMPPRRPHTNELLYYPLDVREDEDELDERYYYQYYAQHRKAGVHGGGNGDGGGAGGGAGWKDRWEYCPSSSSSLNAAGGGSGVFGGLGDGIDGDGMLDGEGGGEGEGEEGEWCDPWPTNDDWRRFRRRWVRAMVAAASGVGSPSSKAGAAGERGLEEEEDLGGERGAKGAYHGSGCAGHGYGGQKGAVVQDRTGRNKVCLPAWRIKGASLLWRYTRGVGGGI